jgi:diguanylate cyclase (GGDEF)-like protein
MATGTSDHPRCIAVHDRDARRVLRCLVGVVLVATQLMLAYATVAHAATRYAEGSGLPNQTVNAITRDARGYWWFGTEDGLVRFDGHQFVEADIAFADAPIDTHVIALAATPAGVYAATRSRVVHVDVGTLATTRLRAAEGDIGGVLTLAADADGRMHAGTREGVLWRLPPGPDGAATAVALDGAVRPTSITEMDLDGAQAWLAGIEGVWKLDLGSGRVEPFRYDLPALDGGARHVRGLLADGDTLWIGYWNDGLVRVDTANGAVRWFHPGQPGAGALRATSVPMLALAEGRLYAGTNRGLVVHEPACDCLRGMNLPAWDEVDGVGVIVLAVAAHGDTVFAGMFGGGAVRFGPGNLTFEHVVRIDNRDDGLGAPMVRSLAIDADGRLLIGTYGGAVQWARPEARIRGEPWRLDSLPWAPTRTESRFAWSLEPADDGLWIGTGGGLFRWTGQRLDAIDPRIESIRDTLRDAAGRRWVGSSLGLFEAVEDRLVPVPIADDVSGARTPIVWCLANVGDELWAGTDDGLYRLDADRRVIARHQLGLDADALPGAVVHAIHADDAGRLWVATSGGLVQARRDDAGLRFEAQPALLASRVRAVLSVQSDLDGRLWLGTQRGLVRYDLDNGGVRRYDQRDGLASDQFTANAAARDSTRLYFGTVAGVVAFVPSELDDRPARLEPQVAWLRVGDGPWQGADSVLALAHDHPPLRVELTALDYVRPERLRYAYRWGKDGARTPLGDAHSAIFSDLPAGRRSLHVEVWTDGAPAAPVSQRVLDVDVAPAWHETPWGRGLLLAAVLLAAWLASSWRLRYARAQRRALEARVVERTRELAAATDAMQEANRRLRELATRDPLTGLANRRSLFDVAAAWREAGHAMAVLMIDLDHFKRINDEHGHEAGDAVLRAFAEVLRQHARDGDLGVRYGGEEFLWLAHGATRDDLPRLGARLLEATRALRIALADGRALAVTVSIGAATMRDGEAIDALVRRADAALYAAKGGGRDRVVVAD